MYSVAIEGLDGSGKTSICKSLSDKFHFEHRHDHLESMLNLKNDDEFFALKDRLRGLDISRSLLFMSSMEYAMRPSMCDIVLDRHLLSEYLFDGNEQTIKYFDGLIKDNIIADRYIILYASPEERLKRILCRNINDSDIKKIKHDDDKKYEKMINFAQNYNLNYSVINTNNREIDDILKTISLIILNDKKQIKELKE